MSDAGEDAFGEPIESDVPIPILGYGIMGRLAQSESTGYDLSLLMGPPRNFIWEAKHSQIYPVLATLRRAGCVTYSEVEQDGKPDKKVYRLTERGFERLRLWARQGPTRTPMRNEFFMKIVASWTLAPGDAVDMLELQVEMLREEIDMMDDHLRELPNRAEIRPLPLKPSDPFYGLYAVISHTKRVTELTIETCLKLIAEFQTPPVADRKNRR